MGNGCAMSLPGPWRIHRTAPGTSQPSPNPPFARCPGDICHRSTPPHRDPRPPTWPPPAPPSAPPGQGPALVAARADRDPGPGRGPVLLEPDRLQPQQLLQLRRLQRHPELEGLVLRLARRGQLHHGRQAAVRPDDHGPVVPDLRLRHLADDAAEVAAGLGTIWILHRLREAGTSGTWRPRSPRSSSRSPRSPSPSTVTTTPTPSSSC